MSFSVLQPGLEYFDSEGGFIAFKRTGRYAFALCDPICCIDNLHDLLAAFLEQFPKSAFIQVSRETAACLARFGFSVNVLGTEHVLLRSEVWRPDTGPLTARSDCCREEKNGDSPHVLLALLRKEKDKIYPLIGHDENARRSFWALKRKIAKMEHRGSSAPMTDDNGNNETGFDHFLRGHEREFVRRQFKAAREWGVRIEESPVCEWDSDLLEDISRQWVNTRTVAGNEMVFMTRPFTPDHDRPLAVRLFLAKQNGETIGFAVLDPMFESGRIFGYYADIVRTLPRCPKGTGYLLRLGAMGTIFDEGHDVFSLGMAPLHGVSPVFETDTDGICVGVEADGSRGERRIDNPTTTYMLNSFYKYGNWLYDAKGLAFHKERFHAKMQPTFVCTRRRFPLFEFLNTYSACGIGLGQQIRRLWRGGRTDA